MGVELRGERILKVLANANETAKTDGERLRGEAREHLRFTRESVAFLQGHDVPRTYLAVTAIMLTARAMHGPDELDVLATQAKEDPRGYAASSIGSKIAAFAKEQGINLRATSTQPMNNQPFTFKGRLSAETKVNDRFVLQWKKFIKVAEFINTMSPDQAKESLALLFHLSRRSDVAAVTVKVKGGGKAVLSRVSDAVALFVVNNSDNGKVGQAFAAALLDVTYGFERVVLGDTQDPDATTPGDVQVGGETGVWLWTEAKQKVVQTGDITGFLAKVRKVGGERVVYFALTNSGYSGYIKSDAVSKEADRLGVEVTVVESPREAIDLYAAVAPGTFANVASGLLERFRARMVESGCADDVITKFDEMATNYADLT